MWITLLKSKIHKARVSDAHLNYDGSLTIPSDLMELAGFHAFEKILCANLNNGHRFETYAIPGEPGSGKFVMNGAVARLGQIGDLITIMSFGSFTPEEATSWKPKTLLLDENNLPQNRK